MRRESKTMFEDWCAARLRFRSTILSLPEVGDFVSQSVPSIRTSADVA